MKATAARLPRAEFSPADANGSYTYANYLAWDYPPYVELINGWASIRPTPWTRHQQCLVNLAGEIGRFLKGRPASGRAYMGPLDVRLKAKSSDDRQTDTVVLPDFFVARSAQQVDELGCLGAPEWIIEIVSPSTITHDTRTKFDLYAKNCVQEYWIVYPGEQTVAVYVLENEQYQPRGDFYEPGLIPSRTLPELQLQWADVFAQVG